MLRQNSAESRRKGLVLVVEDHPDTQSALADYLQDQGWTVALASDGEAALRMARERRPDLVCLDLNLPQTSGYEVCEGFRADPTLRDVVIVMMSARRTLDVRAHSIEAGADAYIAKPYDLDGLTVLVEELCRLRVGEQ